MIKFISSKLKSIFIFFKMLVLEEVESDGLVLAPAIGDIIEYPDETRNMVVAIHIEDDMWDIRFANGLVKTINKKGRQKSVLRLSEVPEIWPPIGAKVIRDAKVIIPEKKKFKFKFTL